MCKLVSVGRGDMQVRTDHHKIFYISSKDQFERNEQRLDDGCKRFFKLFEESTEEGSRAAAQKVKKFSKRLTKESQRLLLLHSLHFLVRSSNSEMLSWPSSLLLVMLQLIDPNVLIGDDETSSTLLHHLAETANPFDYSTYENQLILAKQLIVHGANVNAVSNVQGMTPLHKACFSGNVTNLDFVQLLLEKGADPNAVDHQRETPLMYTIPCFPGAAKCLLNWPTTDVNITARSEVSSKMSFLAKVRCAVEYISRKIAVPDNPDRVQQQFLIHQWCESEEMLKERGAIDTAITILRLQAWSRDVDCDYSISAR